MADLKYGKIELPCRCFNHRHELQEFLALEKQDTLTDKRVNKRKKKKPFPKHLRAKNFQP